MHLRCHEATTLDSSGQAPMDHWAGPFQCFHELGSQCDILCRDCRHQSSLAHSSSLTSIWFGSLSLTVTHFPCAPPTDHESFAGLWCFFASAFSSGQGPGHWWGEESDRLLPHLVAVMRLEFITKRWIQPRIRVSVQGTVRTQDRPWKFCRSVMLLCTCVFVRPGPRALVGGRER